MPLITTAQARTLLQISGSTYDTLIAAIIPPLQDFIVEYCNNPFHVSEKYIYASTISFADDDPDMINDSDSGFVDAGFTDGIDVHVENSEDNDGIYYVDTVTAGTLTLDSAEELIVEDAGYAITITRVKFPKGLRLPTAQLIGYLMQKEKMNGISSKSLADYNVTFDGSSGNKIGGFPAGLLADFASYRKIYKSMPTKNYDPGSLT